MSLTTKRNHCKQRAVRRQLFPEKLWDLVNKPSSGVQWSPDGKRIEVERAQLEKLIGTKFRSHNIDSFIRQLHYYGFRKSGNSYHHDKFQRGQPEALITMKRKYSNSLALASPYHTSQASNTSSNDDSNTGNSSSGGGGGGEGSSRSKTVGVGGGLWGNDNNNNAILKAAPSNEHAIDYSIRPNKQMLNLSPRSSKSPRPNKSPSKRLSKNGCIMKLSFAIQQN